MIPTGLQCMTWSKFHFVFQIVFEFSHETKPNRKYDLIIGGIRFENFNSTKFVASAAYAQDDMTWCVGRAKAIHRWKNVYYIPKDIETYTIGALMYIATIFGAYFLTTFEKKPLDLFHCAILSVQTLTGQSSTFNPKRFVMRFFYVMFLLIAFWLTQFFCAFLVTFMSSVLYETQIASIDKIIGHGFQLAGDPDVVKYYATKNVVRFHWIFINIKMSKTNPSILKRKNRQKMFTNQFFFKKFTQEQIHRFENCPDIDECLCRLRFDNKLAVAASRSSVKASVMRESIFCFDSTQNIHNYLVSFMIRSDFTMERPINEILKRIVTSGLIAKWQKSLRLNWTSMKKLSIRFTDARRIDAIDFCFISVLATVIIILSVTALCLENVIHFKKRTGNSQRFWTRLDQLICGQRHYFLLERQNNDIELLPFTE